MNRENTVMTDHFCENENFLLSNSTNGDKISDVNKAVIKGIDIGNIL